MQKLSIVRKTGGGATLSKLGRGFPGVANRFFGIKKRIAFTLAEVLITLGIIGVVSSIVMPIVITRIEKQKNLTVLKRAYSDLHQFVSAYDRDMDCAGNLTYCVPDWGEFATSFARYLVEKQGFINIKAEDFKYLQFGSKSAWVAVYPKDIYESGLPKCIVAKSGLYMYCIDVHQNDNYYHLNGDKFRAKILMFVDSNKFYDLYRGYWNASPRATMGKNIFIAFVMNSERVYPNGAFVFEGGGSSWYYTNAWNTAKTCNPEVGPSSIAGNGCLARIIEDSWQIKYY